MCDNILHLNRYIKLEVHQANVFIINMYISSEKQQEKYNALIKKYYKELYSKSPIPKDSQTKPSLKPRVKTARTRCRTTTPPPVTTPAVPTKRAKSAMLRAVSEATSTSEVTCSLAILPGSINVSVV